MTKKIPIPDKEDLVSKYSEYGCTISQLARDYRVSNPVMRSWLISYDIERKSHKEASTEANNRKRNSPPTKEVLERLYKTNSINQLETIFGVGQDTVYHWLEMYGVKTKTLSDACKDGKQRAWEQMIPDKSTFVTEYTRTKNLTALQPVFELSMASIRKLTKEYDIETHKPWRSVAEIQLFERLQQETGLEWIHSDKKIINPYELDIVCPERKLAVEYCGLYWHSEFHGNKARDYHQKKLESCRKKDYNLITVFESDSLEKVIATIKSKLSVVNRLHARKCSIVQLETKVAREFNNDYHMHGHCNGSVNLGLYHSGELVMVLTMGKSRFNSAFEWECVRMTVKNGLTVVGGASKLFNSFRTKYNPESMMTFSDRRFGEGLVYQNCGFTRETDTNANYWYFNKSNPTKLHSRVAFQKHKLKTLSSYDESLTEWEIMKASGYDRIWDCGNAKYTWYK